MSCGIGLVLCAGGAAASPTPAPGLTVLPAPPVASIVSARPSDGIEALDRQTGELLARLAEGRIAQALALSDAMVERHPTYRLGQLLRAELLSVAALDAVRPLSAGDWSGELVDLLLEARTRLALAQEGQEPALLPRALVQLGDDVSDVIMVDLSRSELRHYRNAADGTALLARHYVSSGSAGFGKWREGDRRTPLGVYRIENLHADSALPELYGAAALTLDYPNALDLELGRTGSGIWLHGVPRANPSRAPWSSEGCVTMSNQHLLRLIEGLDLARTVVVLSDRIEEVSAETRLALAVSYRDALGIRPGQSLIEVPSRGASSHVAVLEPASSWRFLPIGEPALAAHLPASP